MSKDTYDTGDGTYELPALDQDLPRDVDLSLEHGPGPLAPRPSPSSLDG